MKKLLGLLLALTFFSLSFAQLTFWTTEVQPNRLAKQEAIAASFEAATGISVKVIPVEENDLATRVTAAFSAGELPDVIGHPLSQTLGWVNAGILDTEAATEVINNLDSNTFGQGALNLVLADGNFAAVPVSGWTQLVVYRKDLFEEKGLAPPTTFANISAAVEALHNPPEMFGFVAATDPSQGYTMQVLEEFFLANAMTLIDENGKIDVDNERTIEVLNFYKTLVEASPEGNLFWQQSRELYLGGKAAMVVWSPFIMDELAGLRDSAPVTAFDDPASPELAKKTGFITRLAGPSNPEGSSWASVSYFGITVDADTDAAQQFVSYLMTDAYLDWLSFAPEGLFPVRRGTVAEPSKFVDGWAELPVGVDRKAPLSQFYPESVISDIVAGLDVATRWGFAQGEGALVSRLYGTRVMSEVVRHFLDGELTAEEAAAELQTRIGALR